MYAVVRAYARSNGGYRGVVEFKDGRPAYRTKVMPSMEEAWNAANAHLAKLLQNQVWVYGPPPANEYQKAVYAAPSSPTRRRA